MSNHMGKRRPLALALVGLAAVAAPQMGVAQVAPFALAPAKMERIGSVSERFQSYNVEMLEVTGGNFWISTARSCSGRSCFPPGFWPSPPPPGWI